MKLVHAVMAGIALVFVVETAVRADDDAVQQVRSDRAGYAAALVARWEPSARESGRWDKSYSADLLDSLMRLDPENLLAAGEAPSYAAMLTVLATGRREPAREDLLPGALGQTFQDLVYTPVRPCRIVDTRLAVAGALAAGTTRTFEVDSSDLVEQGGNAAGCGIPLGVAQAVEMTIVAVQPEGDGFLTAWGLTEQPKTSVVNYAANDVIADTVIIPVAPGGGPDFALFSRATTHVIVDVLGFFAASTATKLDCTTVASEVTAVPVNLLTNVDVSCGPGRAATGGGYDVSEASIAFPNLFVTSSPLANGWRILVENHTGETRSLQAFVKCCRVPGR